MTILSSEKTEGEVFRASDYNNLRADCLSGACTNTTSKYTIAFVPNASFRGYRWYVSAIYTPYNGFYADYLAYYYYSYQSPIFGGMPIHLPNQSIIQSIDFYLSTVLIGIVPSGTYTITLYKQLLSDGTLTEIASVTIDDIKKTIYLNEVIDTSLYNYIITCNDCTADRVLKSIDINFTSETKLR